MTLNWILELKSLWEHCSSEHGLVATTSCQALVELVYGGYAEFTYVLNGFLNQVPSARNLNGIVEALGQLLMLQFGVLENSRVEYKCPYSVRSPPHPFITVFTYRPESWPLLQQQVLIFCCHGDNRISQKALLILDPFLKFVLLEPHQMEKYQPMRTGLQRGLLQAFSQTSDMTVKKQIISYCINILPCIQIASINGLGEAVQWMSELLLKLIACPKLLDKTCDRLVTYSFQLCLSCVHSNSSFLSLTRLILELGTLTPQVLCSDLNLVLLCGILLEAPSTDCLPLLKTVRLILGTQGEALCSICIGMIILPLLQITTNSSMATQQSGIVSLASQMVSEVKTRMQGNNITFSYPKDLDEQQMTEDGYKSKLYTRLALLFNGDRSAAKSWLSKLQPHLQSLTSVPMTLTNLVSSMLVVFEDTDISSLALHRLLDIAKQDPSQGLICLPLILHTLGWKTCPQLQLEILEAVPKLATHKICIAPLLKTILSLGNSPKQRMKALSLKLLVELWALQDRCFPHLLKAITEKNTKNVAVETADEIIFAKAKAIRDVCKLRPEQHGADMLGPLSDILNFYTEEHYAPAAALALEGLCCLCETEVIELRSAWQVLKGKLISDCRPVVVEKICEFFSLVPALEVKSLEFEVFLYEVVQSLWLYGQSSDNKVRGAAYRALSRFKEEHIKISQLPFAVTEDFILQARAVIQQQENPDPNLTEDVIINFVPGVCYTRILKQLTEPVLTDFQQLMSSLVSQEVESLPRGIYHSSLRRQGVAANQGKAIGSIPEFLRAQYQKNRLPGIRPGLAAGLLFCYDPPLEVGRDGRLRKHYLISHGKQFQQTFETLVNEVPVQPSEWHRSMLIPQAWASFMDRLYTSMLEARKAEIDLQLKRGHVNEEEADVKKNIAWLWVRDTLADSIKIKSRGNPSVQSNSILALSGLALCVHRFATGLDNDSLKEAENCTQHLSHSHWLTVAMETLMLLMDVNYNPKGTLLGMCQQKSSTDKMPASLLAQAAACVALTQMMPVLITLDIDHVFKVITMLTSRLPGQPNTEVSPVLYFYSGLGLGMFLARLFEERFSDVGARKGMLEVMKALDGLEECCLSSENNRSGALLGLGLAITSLCEEGLTESRAHVASIQEKLHVKFQKLEVTDQAYQAHCVCLACVSGSAFTSNILPLEQVNTVVQTLQQAHLNNPQNTGLCLSLGMLCYSLSKAGHPTIGNLRQQVFAQWRKKIQSQDTSPLEKVALLNGLFALVGSERTLIPVKGSISLESGDISIADVIELSSQIVTNGNDLGIQSNSAWMLGHLYLSACAVTENRASVPSNYSYLKESSLLRAIVDFALDAGRLGPEGVPCEQVKVILTALSKSAYQRALPPLNWAGLLSPLMRLNFGEEVKQLCLQIAVSQSTSAPTAAMFLSSWITPPLFNTLQEESQIFLYGSMATIIRAVAPDPLQTFINRGCKGPFQDIPSHYRSCLSVLTGLNKALEVPDPPEAVTHILYQATAELYTALQDVTNEQLLAAMSSCLGNMPDDYIDNITIADFMEPTHLTRGIFTRCYLVAKGKQPIALLNRILDAIFNSDKCDKDYVLWLLTHCFHGVAKLQNEFTNVMKRLQWLLELLGHTRNIATGVFALSDSVKNRIEVVKFAVSGVAAALCLWVSQQPQAVLGLTSDLMTLPQWSQQDWKLDGESRLWTEPIKLLPSFVENIQKEPWNQVCPMFVEWLLTLSDLPNDVIPMLYKNCLQECLLVLRHSIEFKKTTVWTRTVSIV
ncbi:hypothetical protein CHS0354_027755 [Potamilus streckersoni]|uniref:Focadhesin n=1 Tax=Potamilus streckersoni TaxID=2493646 RepID=A0AAE0W5F3_9BIVA|nr:hypothetical protein CHS0354_027755 [Potamilus streckersoni]